MIDAGPGVGPKPGRRLNERLTQSKSEHPKGRLDVELLAGVGLPVI